MAKPKILIIEDEPSLLGLFALYLGEYYNCLCSKSGSEGMALFNNNNVSIILLDLKMHGMDGIEVLKEIRKKSKSVPVFIITGASSHEAAAKCADLGVQGYILKPPRLENLKQRIDECLGLKRKEVFKDKKLDAKLKSAHPIVIGAVKVINDRYRDPALCRELIAETLGICKDHLSKQFHKELDISMPEYISKLRLSNAAQSILDTNDRISDIAFSLGFLNLSYFSSVFKKEFDMSPEEYRRKNRAK